jgi:hypothetical protein
MNDSEHCPSWEADSRSTDQEISTSDRIEESLLSSQQELLSQLTLSWATCVQSTSAHTIF